MIEAAKRLKANKVIEGKPCGWCAEPFTFGEEVAICTSCRLPHHASCWDQKQGCSGFDCANQPPSRLEPVPSAPAAAGKKELPPDRLLCPHCGHEIRERAPFCSYCKRAPTPDGIYRGPTTTAPGAVSSLVCGIIGVLISPIVLGSIVLGPIAIAQALGAKKRIKADPRYTGEGMATAGMVLGIVALGLAAIYVLALVVGGLD